MKKLLLIAATLGIAVSSFMKNFRERIADLAQHQTPAYGLCLQLAQIQQKFC
jgi:hypothetical protein